MKKIVIFSSMLFISMTSYAFETNKPSKQLVQEYLVVSEFQKVADSVAADSIAQIPNDTRPEQRALAIKMIKRTVSWDATKDQVAELVANTYTKQELEAFIKFSKTPEGTTFNRKSVGFTNGFSNIYINNRNQLLKELSAE